MVRRGATRRITTFAASMVAVLLTAGACGDSATEPGANTGVDGLSPGHSRVSVWLTDAPGDIAEAWVTIDAIYLQGHDGDENGEGEDNGESNGNGNGDSGRFYLLEDPTGWINLIELDGETLSLVEGVLIPEGTFAQLRFVVGEALLVTEDGTVYATPGADLEALNAVRTESEPIEDADGLLHCPSCSQSGLKVKFEGGALHVEGESEIILLDFDVTQSFGHIAGKSGKWVMHPVITGMLDFEGDDGAGVGTIAGTVVLDTDVELPACGGGDLDLTVFVPIARMDDVELTTSVAADGTYAFDMVAPGDWDMDFVDTIDFDNGDQLVLEATPDPATATVEPDATATVDYTITSATCNTSS